MAGSSVLFGRFAGCLAIFAAVAATPKILPALDLGDLSHKQREMLQGEIKDYLLANPEVIVEVLQLAEVRERASAEKKQQEMIRAALGELHDDGYSWVGGNPNGDITMVEFMDYRCGFCRRAHPEVKELVRSDGNIRLIIKEFPILGKNSTLSAQFALAVKQAGGNKAYEQAHEALIKMQGPVNDWALGQLANKLGLDYPRIKQAMSSPQIGAQIDRNLSLATQIGIRGTPGFVFGDRLVRGFVSIDRMQKIVAEERG